MQEHTEHAAVAAAQSRRSRRQTAALWCGALVALSIVLGVIGAFVGRGDTPVAVVTMPAVTSTQTGPVLQVEQVIFERAEYPIDDLVRFEGVVRNRGDVAAHYVTVTVTVYDATGAVLASDDSVVIRPVILAGEISPFSGVLFQVDLAPIVRYDARVRFHVYRGGVTAYSGVTYADVNAVELVQISWTADGLTGEARNVSDETLGTIWVLAAGYDASGTLIEVRGAQSTVDRVAPGKTVAVKGLNYEPESPPASFDAFAYAETER